MTLHDLIETLTALVDEHGGDVEVRLAFQPSWPFEHAVGDVVLVTLRERSVSTIDTPVVYIGEGAQLGYLPGSAAIALDWREAPDDDDDEVDDSDDPRNLAEDYPGQHVTGPDDPPQPPGARPDHDTRDREGK